MFGIEIMTLKFNVIVSTPTTFKTTSMKEMSRVQQSKVKKKYLNIPKKHIEIQKKIGSGQFGEVYTANLRNHGRVAVKMLKPSSKFSSIPPQVIQDFRTEVTVHELLGHHPNVVTYFGANIQDDAKESPYIVMDYYTNGSLQDAIPPESKRKDVAIDALRGLLHVHESGYLHRDVAPRNFLLDHTFRAHICDFGLSALRPENAFDGTMIQTRREVKYLSLSLSLCVSLIQSHSKIYPP